MTELEKKSIKTALYFSVAHILLSELWDFLIHYLFPERSESISNLALAIAHYDGIGRVLGWILGDGLMILGGAILVAWIFRKLGFGEEFFDRQKLWIWVLVGFIFSLDEFSELIERNLDSLQVFVLIILAYRYKKHLDKQRMERKLEKSQLA